MHQTLCAIMMHYYLWKELLKYLLFLSAHLTEHTSSHKQTSFLLYIILHSFLLINYLSLIMKKVYKIKSELFNQVSTYTVNEELNKYKNKVFDPKKLEEANRTLRNLKSIYQNDLSL